jgi:hypothetical protein
VRGARVGTALRRTDDTVRAHQPTISVCRHADLYAIGRPRPRYPRHMAKWHCPTTGVAETHETLTIGAPVSVRLKAECVVSKVAKHTRLPCYGTHMLLVPPAAGLLAGFECMR